jgi:RND family efflux transporter MFP subunit
LKELKFSIKAARLKWRNDSLNYERKKMLFTKNVITGAELESAELNFQSSSSNYTSLLLQLEDLKKQLTLNDKLSAKNLSQSLKNSNDFIIKSEINGTVYSIVKNKGELITPQTPLAILGSQNNYILKLQIDEYDIVKIKKGQQVSVRLDSYKGKVFKAVVTKISPIMNERSKTFTIEAQFINAPQTLYPNLSLEANIVINNHSKAICIPVSYLFNDSFVYLKDGSKKRVIVGLKDYDKAEIIEGLANNDEIIIPNEN